VLVSGTSWIGGFDPVGLPGVGDGPVGVHGRAAVDVAPGGQGGGAHCPVNGFTVLPGGQGGFCAGLDTGVHGCPDVVVLATLTVPGGQGFCGGLDTGVQGCPAVVVLATLTVPGGQGGFCGGPETGVHGRAAVDLAPGGQGGIHCPVNGSLTVPREQGG
jgi:hypothetical protein